MFRFFTSNRIALLFVLCVLVFAVGAMIPHALYAASVVSTVPGTVSAPAQQAPDPNSFIPAILQIALIVLIAQGVKSLGKQFGLQLEGKEAAIAYIVVGLIVYGFGILITVIPPEAAVQVKALVGVLATLLAGSGLYSMTSAFRA